MARVGARRASFGYIVDVLLLRHTGGSGGHFAKYFLQDWTRADWSACVVVLGGLARDVERARWSVVGGRWV